MKLVDDPRTTTLTAEMILLLKLNLKTNALSSLTARPDFCDGYFSPFSLTPLHPIHFLVVYIITIHL